MLRLLSDENFNGDIVRGLLLHQHRLDLLQVIRFRKLKCRGSLETSQADDRSATPL